ncbi:hypothetical protein ACFT8P_23570 [Streptomyces sp. NPDC057101]|uniref:hypothetical protein n=1 Tax=Streptomyces sp. NPDC057101 TaxID=3346020 RepID=UPI00363A1862
MTLVPPAAAVVVPPLRPAAPAPAPDAPPATDTGVRDDSTPAATAEPPLAEPSHEQAGQVGQAPHAEPPHAGPPHEQPAQAGEPPHAEPPLAEPPPEEPPHSDPGNQEAAPAVPPPAPSGRAPGPRVRPVRVDPPAGARADAEDGTPRGTGRRPRFGVVAVPEPSRAASARRRSVPSVRAVRLTDEPATPADRSTTTAAAVTPVPLPVPRPATPAVPTPTPTPTATESPTEEPQP